MNYQDVVNTLITLANQHKMIKTVGYGNVTDLVNPVGQFDRNYPYMFINPQNMTLAKGMMVTRFNLIMMELCTDDTESVIKAQSESIQYIQDILAHLYYHYDKFDFTLNFSIQPFKERFNDSVAGATALIELQIPQILDDCITPFEPEYELVIQRRTSQIHTLDFDGYPDNEDNFWQYREYSYDGITWTTNVSAVDGLSYHSFQCPTSGYYKIEFNNICKFNEPEDGSGRLKYNIDIQNVPLGSIWQSTMSNIPWISDDTIVEINGTFEGYLTAGNEYYFYIGQGYATLPTADEVGYQQIGSTVKLYKQVI